MNQTKNIEQLQAPIVIRQNQWGSATVAETLNPARLATLIMSANEGHLQDYLTLAGEMEERDCHYASVLGVRKRAVSALEPVVEAATDEKPDQVLADAVRELVRTPEFACGLEDLLDAIGKGFAVVKINWDYGKLWRPRSYDWVDPRWFEFDELTGDIKFVAEFDEAKDLPPYRFITHYPRLRTGQAGRGA